MLHVQRFFAKPTPRGQQTTRRLRLLHWPPLLVLLLCSTPVLSRPADDRREAALSHRIEALITQGEADKAFWGIAIYSPAHGRTLYSRNAHRYFIPASAAKLFTTAAALDLLGPDHRFRTVVGTRSRLDSAGRVLGHLYLVGGGDPDLSGCRLPYVPRAGVEEPEQTISDELTCQPTQILEKLADDVVSRGVREVTGDLVADTSYFSPEPYPLEWAVGDLFWSYGAPVRALSLADNAITLRVEPGERVNDRARISWQPYSRFYEVQNLTWTVPAGADTQPYLRRDPGSRVLEVSGPIALGHPAEIIRVAVEEPAEFVGELFRQALEQRGVRVVGRVRPQFSLAPPFARPPQFGQAPEPASELSLLLAEHLSLPLVEDIKLINKESQNLQAELLLRMLGRQPPAETTTPLPDRRRRLGEPPPRLSDGSTEAGLAVLRAWLANAGLNPNDVALQDGSGLSRRNLLTPHAVVQLLQYVERQSWRPLFVDSLPLAGVDGTLAERMRDPSMQGRVRAKTGSLGGAKALAGYLQTQAGETLLLAIFVNHHTLTNRQTMELIDQICELLVELPRLPQKTEKGN